MDSETYEASPKEFADVVGNRLDVWSICVGQAVHHADYGDGLVTAVEMRNGHVELNIRFNRDAVVHTMLAALLFQSGKVTRFAFPIPWEQLQMTIEIATQQGLSYQKAAQLTERDVTNYTRFRSLKQKYGVLRFADASPCSPLFTILMKLENKIDLSHNEYHWLNEEALFEVIAVHQERCYQKTSDPWRAIYASWAWRRAGHPDRALSITQDLKPIEPEIKSVILTTRGAAFADLGDLNEAERLAKLAMKHQSETGHVYALLARIASERGLTEEAERLGRIAAARGGFKDRHNEPNQEG